MEQWVTAGAMSPPAGRVLRRGFKNAYSLKGRNLINLSKQQQSNLGQGARTCLQTAYETFP
jgi:hypothetical protein